MVSIIQQDPCIGIAHMILLSMTGMIAYMAANAISIVLFLIARYSMAKSNRERMARGITKTTTGMTDLTDREDPNFIYRL